jgi:uncharacterized membrane protein (UPF0127 family)
MIELSGFSTRGFRAFSSETGTGSRRENAIKQGIGAFCQVGPTGKSSSAPRLAQALSAKQAKRPLHLGGIWPFAFSIGLVSTYLLTALTLSPLAQAQAGLEKLVLETASGPHEFAVEVMRTDAELEKGLMFRKYLPENRGMLFDFKAEKPVLMWMKNTYLPLDMIFISRKGQVTAIAENAEPLSERIISSNGPVYGVLEVNAGTVSKIALKIGDHVGFPLFNP